MQSHFVHTMFTLVLCLLLMSCGAAPQGERLPIPTATRSRPASATPAAPATSATGSLPRAATIDFTRQPLLEVLFRKLDVNRIEDLYATTRGKVDNLSVVSNCNLDVLKAFVATGWAPIIASRRSGGGRLSAVMRYDDADQHIQIGNPIGKRKKGPRSRVGRTLTYSDFEKEWATGSGNKCVLVTPRKLSEVEIHADLRKYLPKEQVAQIKVRSR